MANTWEEVYYTRSQDRKAEWLYSARYHNGGVFRILLNQR